MPLFVSAAAIRDLRAAIVYVAQEIKRMSDTLQGAIAQLTADVQASRTVQESAITLLNGIPGLIANAIAQAAAGGATSQQLQALQDLHNQIQQESAALAAAVTANTSADTGASTVSGGAEPAPA